MGKTPENLKLAADGEHYEWTQMYAGFADEAEAEGFNEIAAKFRMVLLNRQVRAAEEFTFSDGKSEN